MRNDELIDNKPDTISTPEGDGDFLPDEPLGVAEVEASVAGLVRPPGDAPLAYEEDRPSSFIEVLDEVSRGKIQP